MSDDISPEHLRCCRHCRACGPIMGESALVGEPPKIRHSDMAGASWTRRCPGCAEATLIAKTTKGVDK
jgi:hypothetical protein